MEFIISIAKLLSAPQDSNYTYKYQQHHRMKNEVRIFPGDELLLECELSTTNRDKFTFVRIQSIYFCNNGQCMLKWTWSICPLPQRTQLNCIYNEIGLNSLRL